MTKKTKEELEAFMHGFLQNKDGNYYFEPITVSMLSKGKQNVYWKRLNIYRANKQIF